MSEKVYQDSTLALYRGDCLEVMRVIPDNSVDSIVTDPPYGLGFMGKAWDALPPGLEWAEECLRVLKPGGHLLAFGGTRTWHRLAVAVEDAGFEIRDSIAWMYGTGFPKSFDVSKAIDKAAGADRVVLGVRPASYVGSMRRDAQSIHGKRPDGEPWGNEGKPIAITAPATPAAEQWEGWGTALKPAFEPVVVARKPFTGTVATNVLEYGTGALNIDSTRIGPPPGRWPANVVLDEDMAEVLDEQSGTSKSTTRAGVRRTALGILNDDGWQPKETPMTAYGDSGGASRFFYVAKAPKKERPVVDGVAHPTVKPVALMQWLVKLVTPAGGIVLDPFEGSGTTAQACALEGFKHIGIEREADYLPLIAARLGISLELQPA
jgi:site-specific DNA-methyltransferase (adenine-specific)